MLSEEVYNARLLIQKSVNPDGTLSPETEAELEKILRPSEEHSWVVNVHNTDGGGLFISQIEADNALKAYREISWHLEEKAVYEKFTTTEIECIHLQIAMWGYTYPEYVESMQDQD